MTWTKQPPKERGWYWYRGDYAGISAGVQPVVILVSDDSELTYIEGLSGWQPFMDFAEKLTDEHFPGEWWDQRIPEPPA